MMIAHFRDDEKGRERAMRFLPWHFEFFCRYRPLPRERWEAASREHPLMQTRFPDDDPGLEVLERLLRDARPEVHLRLATLLWEAVDPPRRKCVRSISRGDAAARRRGRRVATAHG
jgi:tRNA-dihydrouridine synthase 3